VRSTYGFDDLVEVIRHFAGCHDYDQAVSTAFQAYDLVEGAAAVAALLTEVVPLIPVSSTNHRSPQECRQGRAASMSSRVNRCTHRYTVT
jgi:hypothetical protein